MRGTKSLAVGFAAGSLLLMGACSRAKAPGRWLPIDTKVGDAFTIGNFLDENTGWINGFTDRDYAPPEDTEGSNSNANASARKPEKKAGKTEDPLKANQGFEVLQTTDGGQTWSQLPNQFKHKIRSVWFVDSTQGWALTIARDILHTIDGGATWETQRKAKIVTLKLFGNRRQPETKQPEQIERVYFSDSRHGWAWGGGRKDQYAEQPGTFLSTVDGGQNWNEIPYPFPQNVWSIFFLNSQTAWANDADGGLYRTNDGGLNWTKLNGKMPEMLFDSIFFLDGNYGWVAGRSGRLANTSDGGRTWKKIHSIRDEFKMRSVGFFDREHGWAVGDNGALLYTADGGESWSDYSIGGYGDLKDLVLFRGRGGWAVGLGGTVLRYDLAGSD